MRLRHFLIPAFATATALTIGAGAVSAAPTRVGVERFTLTADIDSEGGVVTASGVINAVGTDIVVSDTQDTFDFGDAGQVTVFHSPVRNHDHFNKNTCAVSFSETGTYVFGNGTGEWAGYSGSGTYTLNAKIDDVCIDPPVGTFTISAKGPITLAGEG
jgi:hypothetical protein